MANEEASTGDREEWDLTLEPLLKTKDVAEILRVPSKTVHDLPIQRVRVSRRRVRWRPSDVRDFIERRLETG